MTSKQAFWFTDDETGLSIPPFCGGDGPPADPAGTPPAADPPADPNGGEPPVPPPPAERMVPVSALVAERRRYAGQINSLSSQIAALTEKIDAGQQRQPAGADDPQDAERKKVEKYYGIDVLKEQLAELREKAAGIDQLKAQTEQLSNMFTSRENVRMNRAEAIGVKAYDASLGVEKEVWDQWVASQMTNDDIEEIVVMGNVNHMHEVVKRAKGILARGGKPAAPPASLQRDLRTVSRLPASPAPGGNPPTPPAEEKLTGRALHHRAASRLQEVFERSQRG